MIEDGGVHEKYYMDGQALESHVLEFEKQEEERYALEKKKKVVAAAKAKAKRKRQTKAKVVLHDDDGEDDDAALEAVGCERRGGGSRNQRQRQIIVEKSPRNRRKRRMRRSLRRLSLKKQRQGARKASPARRSLRNKIAPKPRSPTNCLMSCLTPPKPKYNSLRLRSKSTLFVNKVVTGTEQGQLILNKNSSLARSQCSPHPPLRRRANRTRRA